MWEILFRYISREIISSVGDPVPIYFKGDNSSVGRKYPFVSLFFKSYGTNNSKIYNSPVLCTIWSCSLYNLVLFFVQFGPVLCTIWSCSVLHTINIFHNDWTNEIRAL